MENIEKAIMLLSERRIIYEERFAKEEKKRIAEYNNLMNKLQTLKDERNDCKESISKNLQRLTTHEHSIYKLIHNSESVPGLPVSHDYHRQAIMFLSEGIDFINNLENVYKTLDNSNKDNDNNSTNLVRNITFCTNSIGTELHKIKSLISEVKTLQNNADILQEYCLVNNDEDMEVE
ncbi:hypothetical protein ANTPLA_LOCUS2453 [Anthophora plagiata]